MAVCAPFSSFRMKPTTSHFTLPAAHPSLWSKSSSSVNEIEPHQQGLLHV